MHLRRLQSFYWLSNRDWPRKSLTVRAKCVDVAPLIWPVCNFGVALRWPCSKKTILVIMWVDCVSLCFVIDTICWHTSIFTNTILNTDAYEPVVTLNHVLVFRMLACLFVTVHYSCNFAGQTSGCAVVLCGSL